MAIGARVMMAVTGLSLLGAGSGVAGMRPVSTGIEATNIWVDAGQPITVRVRACDVCPQQKFELADEAQLFVKGSEVGRDQLTKHQGKPGTVVYRLETGKVIGLRWW